MRCDRTQFEDERSSWWDFKGQGDGHPLPAVREALVSAKPAVEHMHRSGLRTVPQSDDGGPMRAGLAQLHGGNVSM
jgi:hypothetical protein